MDPLSRAQSLVAAATNGSGCAVEMLEDRLQSFLLEIMRDCIRGRVDTAQTAALLLEVHMIAKSKLAELAASASIAMADGSEVAAEDVLVPGLVVDIIWQLDIELVADDAEAPIAVGMNAGAQQVTRTSLERARLVELVKRIIVKNFVPHVLFKERMEPELLESVGVVQSHRAFTKKSVRLNTALLYKQQKFNLLREESEGFSMLETYLASNLPRPLDSYWQAQKSKITLSAVIESRKRHIKETAQLVIRNITSLIGYFDLNPNKVLDVILDVFIANVSDHWDFFIELLEASHWRSNANLRATKDGGEEVAIEGGTVCGQILGFKFDYYNKWAPSTQSTPAQLFWIAAMLIRHRLVRLEDLYPHLSPSDDDIDAEYQTYLKKIEKDSVAVGRHSSLLAEAGALGDDFSATVKERGADIQQSVASAAATLASASANSSATVQDTKPNRRSNQKALLASHLVAIGDLTHAKIILDRLPKLCHIYSDVADNMCRLLHVIVEPVYKSIRPSAKFNARPAPQRETVPVNTLNPKHCQIFEKTLIGKKTQPPKFKFFYDPWKDDLPSLPDYDSLLPMLRGLLPYIGAHLSRDTVLISKVARIGKSHLEQTDIDERTRNSWITILAKFLLPALSLTSHNPGLVNEIWSLVKLFSYDRRYALYGEWKHSSYDVIPELKKARAGCIQEAKYVMRRLSKETTKQYGRHIGKLVHSNPAIAFTIILEQLQAYDNQVPFVVDASKYLTELGFDVLSFCLIEALAVSKNRLQSGGTSVKQWLKSLANFAGVLFRKHSQIELPGFLRYIFCQLVRNNVEDLIVLQDLVSNMSGMKTMDDATEAQIEAMAGGETLRRQALFLDTARSARKSSLRLIKGLLDTDLVYPLMVLLGRHRRDCIFRVDEDEIKILGWLQDNVQRALLQFAEFLASSCDRKVYAQLFPSVRELCLDNHLDAEVAFHILRPKLLYLMAEKAKEKSVTLAIPEGPDVDSSASVVATATDDSSITNSVAKSPLSSDMDLDMSSRDFGLQDTIDAVVEILPSKIWATMSARFYVLFWQLSLYDIFIPEQRYQVEVGKLTSQLAAFDTEKKMDAQSSAMARRKKERDRSSIAILQTQLNKELKDQKDNFAKVHERLLRENNTWFILGSPAEYKTHWDSVIECFMQYCLFPRLLFSPGDAIYCSKLIFRLHGMGTLHFSTVILYDKILNTSNLQSLIFSCSELEAKNFGIFLADMLLLLEKWYKDKELYEKEGKGEGAGLPGFALRWTPEAGFLLLDYEKFLSAIVKWHHKMHKAFVQCLDSKDYVQIRNAILVLDKIKGCFPVLDIHGTTLWDKSKQLVDKEERQDLKQLATAYSGYLTLSKSNWVSKSKFSNVSAVGDADHSTATPKPPNAQTDRNTPDRSLKVSSHSLQDSSHEQKRVDREPEVDRVDARTKVEKTKSDDRRESEGKPINSDREWVAKFDRQDSREHISSRSDFSGGRDSSISDSHSAHIAPSGSPRRVGSNVDQSPSRRDRDALPTSSIDRHLTRSSGRSFDDRKDDRRGERNERPEDRRADRPEDRRAFYERKAIEERKTDERAGDLLRVGKDEKRGEDYREEQGSSSKDDAGKGGIGSRIPATTTRRDVSLPYDQRDREFREPVRVLASSAIQKSSRTVFEQPHREDGRERERDRDRDRDRASNRGSRSNDPPRQLLQSSKKEDSDASARDRRLIQSTESIPAFKDRNDKDREREGDRDRQRIPSSSSQLSSQRPPNFSEKETLLPSTRVVHRIDASRDLTEDRNDSSRDGADLSGSNEQSSSAIIGGSRLVQLNNKDSSALRQHIFDRLGRQNGSANSIDDRSISNDSGDRMRDRKRESSRERRDRGDKDKDRDRRSKDREKRDSAKESDRIKDDRGKDDRGKDRKDRRRSDKDGSAEAISDDRHRKREREHNSNERESKRSKLDDRAPGDGVGDNANVAQSSRKRHVEENNVKMEGGTADIVGRSQTDAAVSLDATAKRVKINRASSLVDTTIDTPLGKSVDQEPGSSHNPNSTVDSSNSNRGNWNRYYKR